MQKPPEKLWALVLQTNLGSKNLFFKSFLPLCSVVLPSGEEIWCLLLFLEFHLLESWEYCRPQLSEHKRYISSIDRWRKSRKSLWICKQSKLKQAPYSKSFFRPNIFLTCLMAFEIWAVTSNLLKGGGEIEKKYALKPRLSSCYWWNTKKYRNIKLVLWAGKSASDQALLRLLWWQLCIPVTSHFSMVLLLSVFGKLTGQLLQAECAYGLRVPVSWHKYTVAQTFI